MIHGELGAGARDMGPEVYADQDPELARQQALFRVIREAGALDLLAPLAGGVPAVVG
ncbi:MAG: hypothetical protein ACRDYD_06245 [Acidimicrobiales bacterium]